jgi:TetR/AcrR family transcriptional regulator, multidrug resistance operon repressor
LRPVRLRDPRKEKAIRVKALKMIVDQGLDGFGMQRLAAAAKVSPATIYIYFEDREDLLVQLYVEEMGRMAAATLAGFDAGMRFAEGLRIQWFNRARYFLKHPVEMHFLEQIKFSPLYERASSATDPTFVDTMQRFVANAIRRKELMRIPVEVYWSVAFAPLYNLVKYHMHGRSFVTGRKFVLDDRTLTQTLELVLKALKP